MTTIDDIHMARKRIGNAARLTPLIEAELLNRALGLRVLVKAENLQNTGAFKIRGATNCIKANLEQNPDIKSVFAYSSGNHAQGVALAAANLGLECTILMPEDAPASKINNTKAYGSEVVLFDRYTQDRDALGARLASEKGATLIKPFDDPHTMAGQGTIGLEIAEQLGDMNLVPDALVVPCGGGGLIAGISIALKHSLPEVRIFAAEPELYNDTKLSLIKGEPVAVDTSNKSICDAIVTPRPGDLTFPFIKEHVENSLLVSDEEALRAVRIAFEHLKLVIEPGGAAALAAVLSNKLPDELKTVVVVASGGNVDANVFKQALETE